MGRMERLTSLGKMNAISIAFEENFIDWVMAMKLRRAFVVIMDKRTYYGLKGALEKKSSGSYLVLSKLTLENEVIIGNWVGMYFYIGIQNIKVDI